MTAILLICSALTHPVDCSDATALRASIVPGAVSEIPTECMKVAMEWAAKNGVRAGPEEYVMVTCKREREVPT